MNFCALLRGVKLDEINCLDASSHRAKLAGRGPNIYTCLNWNGGFERVKNYYAP